MTEGDSKQKEDWTFQSLDLTFLLFQKLKTTRKPCDLKIDFRQPPNSQKGPTDNPKEQDSGGSDQQIMHFSYLFIISWRSRDEILEK